MKYYKLIDILQQIAGDENNYIQILQGIHVPTVPTQQPVDPKAQNNGPPQRPADGAIDARRVGNGSTVHIFDQNANQGENANSKDPFGNLKKMLNKRADGHVPKHVANDNNSQNKPGGSGKHEGTKETEHQQPSGVTNPEAGNNGPTKSATTNKKIDAQNAGSGNESNEPAVINPNRDKPRLPFLGEIRNTDPNTPNKPVDTGKSDATDPSGGSLAHQLIARKKKLKRAGKPNQEPNQETNQRSNNKGIMASVMNKVPEFIKKDVLEGMNKDQINTFMQDKVKTITGWVNDFSAQLRQIESDKKARKDVSEQIKKITNDTRYNSVRNDALEIMDAVREFKTKPENWPSRFHKADALILNSIYQNNESIRDLMKTLNSIRGKFSTITRREAVQGFSDDDSNLDENEWPTE